MHQLVFKHKVETASVSLTWTAPTTGTPATGYTIQQSTDGTTSTASTPSTITGTTAMVTGLTNEQVHTLQSKCNKCTRNRTSI